MASSKEAADGPPTGNYYEFMAEKYIASVDSKPHNAFYERPATLALLPPLNDLDILDAGCGSGWYAAYFLEHGAASVTCIDASQKMVAATQARLGSRVKVQVADLSQPLDFAANESFDLVVSALVLHYLADLNKPLQEFRRVLKSCGRLVFSIHHPSMVFREHDLPDYYDSTLIEEEWSTGKVAFYHHPLTAYCDALMSAGFVIERLYEPRPVEEYEAHDPLGYVTLMHNPWFMVVRARRDR